MPLTRISKSTWYLLTVIYASMLGMTVLSMVYAQHVANESSRNWCATVGTLDDAYQQQPPASALGQKLARDIHNLRARLHCKGSW